MRDSPDQDPKGFEVVEGVQGTWFYHLSEAGSPSVSLCGARTMCTSVPLKAWGTITHLKERWCSKCKGIAEEEKRQEKP